LLRICHRRDEQLLFTPEPPDGSGFRCVFGPTDDGEPAMQVMANAGTSVGRWSNVTPRADGWALMQSPVHDRAFEGGGALLCEAMHAAGLLPTDVFASYLPEE